MSAVKRTFRTPEETRALLAVARGDAPPDLLITNGQILNVYSGETLPGSIAVAGRRIAYVGARPVEPGPKTLTIDARGRVLAPGYVDPHAHPQAMFTPAEGARTVLPLGTTTMVADTILLLAATRSERTAEIMTALSALPLHFFWFLRLHGQSHTSTEDVWIDDRRLADLLRLDTVRAVGEVTRWPLVYAGDPQILGRIALGLERGRRVEGHAPGVAADRLQALAAAGISSDHEAITAEQALDRLRAGMYVMLRHSSLRLDLPSLLGVASGARAFSGRLMLTPDGPSPDFILQRGYVDHLIRIAIDCGLDPVAAYQMATLNPATYYGLDEEIGGLAPGRRADINVLPSLREPRPEVVIADGRTVAEDGRLTVEFPDLPWAEWIRPLVQRRWHPDPSLFSLDGAPSPLPGMHLQNAVIAARRDVEIKSGSLPDGVLRFVLIDPAGRWRVRTCLSGLADRLGGLASTFSTAGGIYVAGSDPRDMSIAASRVLELGGGVVVAEEGAVRFELPLPLAGVMSARPMREIVAATDALTALLRERGYPHHDLPYTLLFFGFDALPYVRLTYLGLWDVLAAKVLIPREEL
jgi:adenine deaminase